MLKETDGLLSESLSIPNRLTLCAVNLLNRVYFLDPYPSAPVVLIEPLSYFLGCASAVMLGNHPLRIMLAAAGFLAAHAAQVESVRPPLATSQLSSFFSDRSWTAGQLASDLHGSTRRESCEAIYDGLLRADSRV